MLFSILYLCLVSTENQDRFHRNELKVHRGENGVFGKDGVPHHTDPFDEVAFLADYDDMATFHVTEDCISSLVSSTKSIRRWRLSVCPHHQNYHSYPVVDFYDMKVLQQGHWFRTFSMDDLCLLEEIVQVSGVPGQLDPSRWEPPSDGIQVRLVGWESMATEFGNYDY